MCEVQKRAEVQEPPRPPSPLLSLPSSALVLSIAMREGARSCSGGMAWRELRRLFVRAGGVSGGGGGDGGGAPERRHAHLILLKVSHTADNA